MLALEPSSCLLIPKSPSLTTPSLVRKMFAVFKSLKWQKLTKVSHYITNQLTTTQNWVKNVFLRNPGVSTVIAGSTPTLTPFPRQLSPRSSHEPLNIHSGTTHTAIAVAGQKEEGEQPDENKHTTLGNLNSTRNLTWPTLQATTIKCYVLELHVCNIWQ